MVKRTLSILLVLALLGVQPNADQAVAAPGSQPQARCVSSAATAVRTSDAQAPEPRALTNAMAASTYSAPLTPQRMIPGDEHTVAVTVTNTTAKPWPKSDFVLSYRWKLPDGTDYTRPSNRAETSLPNDLATGKSATFNATVKAPIHTDLGNQREAFILDWDLRNIRSGKWLSESDGVAPLSQPVTAEYATSNQLGLEKFYQYNGLNAGAGWTTMVNQFSGNAVVGYDVLSNPSRGLATFVRLTYNSLDNSNSYVGPGWSLSTSSLARLGSPLQFHVPLLGDPDYPTKVTLVDGDGTSHLFQRNTHGSGDKKKWTYDSPAGVHQYLQRTGSQDKARTWVMTQPDRTKVFFDAQGYQTAIADKNGNELVLHYQRTDWGNRNTGVLTHITDATGRRTLTLDYYQQGDDFFSFVNDIKVFGHNLLNTSIINQLRSITDASGRRITFTYSDHGALQEVVDGADTSGQKVFSFFYNGSKVVRVNDPLGHGTQLRYADGRVQELVDRRNHTLGFGYADADGDDGSAISATATDANGHVATTLVDGYGRPVKLTNAKGQATELAWDDDNNVRLVKEDNGATTTWVYDRKTGYPLEIKDAEAQVHGTAPTKIGYRTALDGYVADLTEKTSPEGRKWAFGYDDKGNLKSVTDPKGTATPTEGDYTSRYDYDEFGQMLTATDANGHATRFADHDPSGSPRKIIDALDCATTFDYDVVGNVVATSDARKKTSTFTYDIFNRPLTSKVPKDADVGKYIFTPGPVYDQNDNVVISTAPNKAVTTASYDAADQLVSILAPKDDAKDPVKQTTFQYDAVGNLVLQTAPKGNLTRDNQADFVSTFTYDELNRVVATTDADSNKTTHVYDRVGNLVSTVDPRKNASPDPNDFTAKYAFDLNHRLVRTTDAAGHEASRRYDRDGNVVAAKDQEGNETLVSLDERASIREVKVPHKRDDSGAIVYHTTQYVYDAIGNQTKTITPRGVETTDDPDDFVQEVVYDELGRVKEQLTPFDKDDERVKTPDRTFFSYDEVGRLIEVSAPPSGDQSVRNISRTSYFDTGWIRSSVDSWDIRTTFGYDELGNQTVRELTAAGGSAKRAMSWKYYPDGKLKERRDDGAPVGRDVLVVDNSDPAVEIVGNWGTAGSGEGHEGYDYRTHGAGTGNDKVIWNVDVPRSGTYEVFVRYTTSATATDASYTVEHDGGSETKKVDQTQTPTQWVSLGKYGYTEDAIKKITLSDNANGTVVADAIKVVRDGTGESDNEQKTFGYVYDPNDNLALMTDSSPDTKIDSYAIGYTGLNQVAQIDEKLKGTVQKTTKYTYDANGNPLTRSHNTQNAIYEYGDPRDLLTKITNTDTGAAPQVTTYTYTPRALRLLETKANGNTVAYDEYYLDGLPRHEVERKPSGTVVNEHRLDYDANGQRLKDVGKKMNADNHSAYLEQADTYVFDPRDRVRKVIKSGGETESYEHDANNNVVKQTVGGKTTTYTFDRNRLVSSKNDQVTATNSYDPYGRLDKVTSAGKLVEKYRYDGFDRVIENQKLQPNGVDRVTVRNVYDPMDRTTTRIENLGAGEKKTEFTYLGMSSEVLTEELAGKVQKSYQYSPSGERLSQVKHNDNGARENGFYGYNAHTDVETLTDEKGDTRATYGYTAYGSDDKKSFTGIDKPDPQNPAKDLYNPYRFNSKRFDQVTGDYDMGFRDYDPGRNAFVSRDNYNGALSDLNLGTNPWTGNRYAFGGGNPITMVEVDGHEPCPSGKDCNYLYTGESKYAPTPEIREIRQQQEKEERWRSEYEQAINDLPEKYKAREILSDPGLQGMPAGDMVSSLADRRFCERLGNADECAEAFTYIAAATTAVSIAGISLTNQSAAANSAQVIKGAAERALSGGWQKVLNDNLSDAQKELYRDHLKNGRYYYARGLLGHAAHNAVANELEKTYPGRFDYNASKGPDFRDRQNPDPKARVEFTTQRSHAGHLAKGGIYRKVPYVLYRGPGTLPQLPMRYGGGR